MMLQTRDGTFGYPGGNMVLESVSFCVESGDLLAILGPNGAGKTTLLRCVMGLLRWTRGDSLLDGVSVRDLPAKKLWRHMAYVPQARTARLSNSAWETVLLGRSSRIGLFGQPGEADFEAAHAAMNRLGILRLKDKRMDQMSGGEAQMVLIARALAAEPGVLILDEPESNLDFKNQLLVLDAMSDLAREGMICVFNTHYPAHALRRANKAILLGGDGKAVFGSTGQVITEEEIRRAFGVSAVIGEIETDTKMVRDVIALRVENDSGREPVSDERKERLAVVSLIARDDEHSDEINALLHRYGQWIVGRMGMPYRKMGLFRAC